METVTVRVRNMICRQCEQTLALGLAKQRGIHGVTASYHAATVTVSYNPARCTRAEISEALGRLGYPEGEGLTGRALDLISLILAIILFTAISSADFPMAPKPKPGASPQQLFLIGAFTSVHCITMCGGIMLAQSGSANRTAAKRSCACGATKEDAWSKIRPALQYNAGRLASYSLIGALAGAFGSIVVYATGVRAIIFALSGALVVLMGARMLGIPQPHLMRRPKRKTRSSLAARRRGRAIASRCAQASPLAIGALTGIMPCGALASMWMVAAASGSAASGAGCMFAFCLGTLPLLLAVSLFGRLLPASWSKYALRISAVLVIALGLCLAQKGLVIALGLL